MEKFEISREVAILNISIFVAGYVVGPLVWGPLSEQVRFIGFWYNEPDYSELYI